MRCPACQQSVPETAYQCPNCRHHRDRLPPGYLLGGGRYRIESGLGRGGFGITYRATELHPFERPVAVKEFYPSSLVLRDTTTGLVVPASAHSDKVDTASEFDKLKAQFVREGKRIARLGRVENVVYVHTLLEENGTAYLVMELLDGVPLNKVLDFNKEGVGRPLPSGRIVPIMDGLVRALTAIHATRDEEGRGLTHLDIKPANIILCADDRPVLIDFGSARRFGERTNTLVSFSPWYAPPEVQTGREVGPESDLYELGMTLYEMASGRSCQHRRAGDLSEPWETLVSQATRVSMEERPRSVAAWWKGYAEHSERAATQAARREAERQEAERREMERQRRAAESVGRRGETTVVRPSVPDTPSPAQRPSPVQVAAAGVAGIAALGLVGVLATNRQSAPSRPTPTPNSRATVIAASPPAVAMGIRGSLPGVKPSPTPAPTPNPATPRLVGLLNRLRAPGDWPRLRPAIVQAVRDGADPDAAASSGPFARLDALHFAAAMGDTATLGLLLDAGADVDRAGAAGATALHQAAAAGKAEAVSLLLRRGAKPDARNAVGKTAYDLTQRDSVRRLLRQASGGTGAAGRTGL